jgi:hypothetical protein
MYLHMADWFHKAIKSENLLFLVNGDSELGSALPYLVGFEYRRPDEPDEWTENVVDEGENRYYRHPKAKATPVTDSWEPFGASGNYSKIYGIYSLGVVLTELGPLEPAKEILRAYPGIWWRRSFCESRRERSC